MLLKGEKLEWKCKANYPATAWAVCVRPALLEVILRDVGACHEPAGVADPHVALEAHNNGRVDRGHHGDLDDGQKIGKNPRVEVQAVVEPKIGKAVHQGSAGHHQEVGDRQDLKHGSN